MKYPRLDKWCADATKKIRYGPDREEVRRELRQHMEDKCDSLRNQGIPEKELEEKVLRSMGDCEEIAPQLAAIHKPFWGFLERLTRYIALHFLVIALSLGFFQLLNYGIDLPSIKEDRDNFDVHAENPYLTMTTDLAPTISAEANGYTFSAPRVGVWRWNEHPDGAGILIIKLRIEDPMPWKNYLPFTEYIWLEDSQGNRYYTLTESYRDNDFHITLYSQKRDVFCTEYDVFTSNLPAEITWVTLHYTRDGRNMELHIDLAGGEKP